MSVVGAREIRRRLLLRPDDPEAICLAPLTPRNRLRHDAIDVHLGCWFLRPDSERVPSISVDSPKEDQQRLIHVPIGREIVLPAHGTVLGAVMEYLRMPTDLSAEILTRSSYARLFLNVASATWIHPGFCGCLTLEISNTSSIPVELKPALPLAQLVFYKTDPPAESEKLGRFAGRTQPHFPSFDADADWLSSLGSDG